MAEQDLTPKQERFVQEYMIDLNATAAYRRAGYSAKSDAIAASESCKLLRNPKVAAAVQAAQVQRAQRTELSADRVLREYQELAFNDLRSVFYTDTAGRLFLRPLSEWPESIGRSISGIKVRRVLEKKPGGDGFDESEVIEFKLWSKTDALEKIAKHLGLLVDRHEHSGLGGKAISHEHSVSDDTRDDILRAVFARLGLVPPEPLRNGHANGARHALGKPGAADGASGT